MKWTTMKGDASLLFLSVLVWCVGFGASMPYQVAGALPGGTVALSVRLWMSLAVVLWVAHDMRVRHCDPWFEYTAFVFIAWPVMLPHYLIRSRGRQGLKLALVFYSPVVALAILYGVVELIMVGWSKS